MNKSSENLCNCSCLKQKFGSHFHAGNQPTVGLASSFFVIEIGLFTDLRRPIVVFLLC